MSLSVAACAMCIRRSTESLKKEICPRSNCTKVAAYHFVNRIVFATFQSVSFASFHQLRVIYLITAIVRE